VTALAYNFILSEMREKGRAFDDVLAEAQELGYAEADSTFDVEGIDAAHKLTNLSALAFGIPLDFSKTYTEGITKITPADVEYANELGYTIKHLGITRKTENGIEQRVHPTLIPKSRLNANVNGVMNAVLVHGDAVGPTLYYGAGAGDEPIASAVVADIVNVVRAMTSDPSNRVPHLAFQPDQLADTPILGMDDIQTAYYLRVCAHDQPGVLASITAIMGASNISIEAFIQREPAPGVHDVDIILLTQRV
jgi:homoserine dehydrogenase